MKALTKKPKSLLKTSHNSWIMLSLLITSPTLSKAQVNLAEGSFRHSQSEYINVSAKGPAPSSRLRAFELLRAYSSKSTSVGLFGLGWCSNLETKLIKVNTHQIEIENCPARSRLKFTKQQPVSVNRFISMIGGEPAVAPQGHFSTESSQNGIITPTENGWRWTLPDGSWHLFSKEGQILEDAHSNGRHIKYKYDSRKKLSAVELKDLGAFNISHLNDGLLIADIHYKFSGRRLAQVKAKNKPTLTYQYDDLDNLTAIGSTDGTSILVGYDDLDRAVFVKTKENCMERYQYYVLAPMKMRVEQNRTCDRLVLHKKAYDFQFSIGKNSERILDRVDITGDGGSQKIYFHARWGFPIFSESNGLRTYYSYNEGGKLIQRRLASEHKEMTYDSQSRLVRLKQVDGPEIEIIYKDQTDQPYMIRVKDEGLIKLNWQGNKTQIAEITPAGKAPLLRERLIQALESLARPSQTLTKGY